jgi:hypothetical protein
MPFIGGVKLKISQIINGDFRQKGLEDEMQSWLRKIEILNKKTPAGQKVRLEDIEKLLQMLCKKYEYSMQYILFNSTIAIERDEMPAYTMSLKDSENVHAGTVYGMTIYEVFGKAVLLLYALIKKEKSKDEKGKNNK